MLNYETEITLNTKEGCENDPKPTTCEDCIKTTTVEFDKCEPIKDQSVEVDLDGEGKWLRVKLTVEGVCRARDVAAGIIVHEVVNGKEKAIAFKVIKLPKIDKDSNGCKDRICECARFAIPPNASACEGTRTFKVRVFAHHLLDSDETIAPCKACTDYK